MLTIISPAKIQNFNPQNTISDYTLPVFLKEANMLAKQLGSYSISELASLLHINSKIAEENANRYFHWKTPFTPENSKQAIFTYNGEVYRGLDAATLNNEEILYLQNHLRILSGLFGALKPLDLIQPYRLDVKDKFTTEKGDNLYSFWKTRVTDETAKAVKNSDNPDVLLNLASAEYTRMLDIKQLKVRIIDFDFLKYNPESDTFKTITIYLKRARGLMVRFIAQNRITDPEDLKAFSADGYWYSERFSTENKMVFVQ